MRRHSQIGPWRKDVTEVSVMALLGAERPPEVNAADLGYAPDMRQEWGSF